MILTANIFEIILPWIDKAIWTIEVVLAIAVLIAVHEFGHFIAGKLTGMKVEEFSIGFGKRLLGFTKGETDYSIRMVPLGGYCKIFGMDDEYDPDDERLQDFSESDLKRAFNNRPILSRFLVIIAGSMMNILIVILAIGIIGSSVGFNYSLIEDVEEGSPAWTAGIRPGDKLRNYGSQSSSGNIVQKVAKADIEKGVLFRVERDDGSHLLRVFPEKVTSETGEEVNRIGITFSMEGNYSRIIDRVLRDSPYEKAGLMPGDEIISVNGGSMNTRGNVVTAIYETPGNEVQLGVLREGKEFSFTLKDHKIYRTGIVGDTMQTVDGNSVVISDVIVGTPSSYMGIRKGMVISEVDGNPIPDGFDWTKYEAESNANEIVVKIQDPRYDYGIQEVPIRRYMPHPGMTVQVNYVKVPLHIALYEGTLQAKDYALMIFETFGMLFKKEANVSELSGIVGIFAVGYQIASEGPVGLIFFFSLISVNLGMLNLMPFPGLDGSRALFLIGHMVTEPIFGRPVIGAKFENLIHFVGLILLLGLILFVTFHDIVRVIGR